MRPRRIRVIKQRKAWDCGVASVAMLVDLPYGDVAALLKNRWPDDRPFRKRGLILSEMIELAGMIGHVLVVKRRAAGYLEGETGILTLRGERYCREGHYVVLKDGMVIDPDGADVWLLKDYMSRHGVRTATLLAWRKS